MTAPRFNRPSALFSFLRRFHRDEEGAVAIEFAIIAFVGFLLTMGILEFALLIYANGALNNAVKEIAYRSATECEATERDGNGRCTGGSNQFLKDHDTTFADIFHAYAGNLISPAEVCIFARPIVRGSTGELTNIPPSAITDFGGSEDIVRIDFRYQWQFFSFIIRRFFPNLLMFQANFLIRNGAIDDASNRLLPPLTHPNCANAFAP